MGHQPFAEVGVDVVPSPTNRVRGVAVDVFERQPTRELPARFRHREAEDLHRSGPQTTNTGFSAASRKLLSGNRIPRAREICVT